MDFNSIIGIAVALIAIFGGQALEGGHLGSLVQFTPLLIVLGVHWERYCCKARCASSYSA